MPASMARMEARLREIFFSLMTFFKKNDDASIQLAQQIVGKLEDLLASVTQQVQQTTMRLARLVPVGEVKRPTVISTIGNMIVNGCNKWDQAQYEANKIKKPLRIQLGSKLAWQFAAEHPIAPDTGIEKASEAFVSWYVHSLAYHIAKRLLECRTDEDRRAFTRCVGALLWGARDIVRQFVCYDLDVTVPDHEIQAIGTTRWHFDIGFYTTLFQLRVEEMVRPTIVVRPVLTRDSSQVLIKGMVV